MHRQCIFCNEYTRMSREHIWPAWFGRMLLKTGKEKHMFGSVTEQNFDQISDDTFERAGHLTSIKLRVVCENCNNTWMSVLEAEVKPLLVDLVNTNQIVLDADKQELLSRWIVLKVITGEHANKKQDIHVTPIVERLRFRSNAEIPPYYWVYIGQQVSDHESAWARQSWTMAFSIDGPKPKLDGLTRNCQTVSFLFGPLMAFVLTVRLDEFDVNNFFQFGPLDQIWPITNENISWPPKRPLTRNEMRKIAWISDELKQGPNIKYVQELPPEN